MKNIIFIYILLLVSTNEIFSYWEFMGPGGSYSSKVFVNNKFILTGGGKRITKTTDNGHSWENMTSYDQVGFEGIFGIGAIDEKLFVATLEGLYSSTNNGKDWQIDEENDSNTLVWDLIVNENDIFILKEGGLLYWSQDVGETWVKGTSNNFHGGRVISISDSNIYIGGWSSEYDYPNYWCSSDYGNSWWTIEESTSGLKTTEIVSIDGHNEDVYAGTIEGLIFYSNDYGRNWVKLSSEFIDNLGAYTIKIYNDTVFVGNNFGLYFSTDMGQSWHETSYKNPVRDFYIYEDVFYLASDGLAISYDKGQIWEISKNSFGNGWLTFSMKKVDDEIWTSSYRNGLFKYDMKNGVWGQNYIIPTTASITDFEVIDSNIFLIYYYTGKFLISNDGGINWTNIKDINVGQFSKVKCVKYDEEKSKVLIGTDMGLYISDDFGKTWSLLGEDIMYQDIRDILIDEERIFCATHNWGIYISNDYGESWEQKFEDEGLPWETPIVALGKCGDIFFAGTASDTLEYLYISTDGGNNWLNKSFESNTTYVQNFGIYGDNVFAATRSGIFISKDFGESWYRPEKSLKSLSTYDFLFQDEHIYVATNEGVYRTLLSDFGITDVEEVEVSINYVNIKPPYPNPARGIVKFNYHFDKYSGFKNDDINIYDLEGNIIADKNDLIFNQLSNTNVEYHWNCINQKNGIYLVHIEHGAKKRTVKVLIQK